jgi:hypothetical protein
MPKRPTFHLMLAPNCQVAVEAADVNTALTVARDARPFLEHASATLSVPEPSSDGETKHTLTCLLCQAVDPEREGRSQLVAMQEHQMEMHGLTSEHFRASVRVFCGNNGEGCYVWAVPPALAKELYLPHLSYLRAIRRRMRPASVADESSVTLVFRHPFDASEMRQEVLLIDEDALAWYGYLRDRASTEEVLMWPKGEWKRAEER